MKILICSMLILSFSLLQGTLENPALLTSTENNSAGREGSDIVISNEVIAPAIAEEKASQMAETPPKGEQRRKS